MNREDVKNWLDELEWVWQSSAIVVEVQIVGSIRNAGAQERNTYNHTNFSPVITLRSATVGMCFISENPVSSNISSISDIE